MMKKQPYLTKSRFMSGLACPKWLWLGWHQPLPYVEPDAGSIQAVGSEIGIHAKNLFPGGVMIDEAAWEHTQAVERTQQLITDPAVPSLFEAAFEHDNVRIRVDVLERLEKGEWGICEVKSSAGVKDDHLNDLAIQLYVLEGNGLDVSSIELIHINNQYVHAGGEVDWPAFFTRTDCAALVRERLSDISNHVADLHKTMQRKTPPDIEAGKHCSGYCGYWDHCTQGKPKEDWIYSLPRLTAKQYTDLSEMGIERIGDIPVDFHLNATQETVRRAWVTGEDFVSDDLGIGLRNFGPPAYYLDFETMAPTIPICKGTRPYQRQPFQWSLHFDDGKGNLDHWEFLGPNDEDPRRDFAETLVNALGDSNLPVIVYSSFEKSVINDMAALFPDLADHLHALIPRLKDLLPIARGYTYFRAYKGSFSIKAVGPTLAPAIDYKALDMIADGGAASSAFGLIFGGYIKDKEQCEKLRQALLAYCKLDTLAMVEVHRALIALT